LKAKIASKDIRCPYSARNIAGGRNGDIFGLSGLEMWGFRGGYLMAGATPMNIGVWVLIGFMSGF
jgi:hypothetical protein